MMSHAAGKHSIDAHTSMPYDVLRNVFARPMSAIVVSCGSRSVETRASRHRCEAA